MAKNIQIEDESGDRRYFTIIPNYILNHSTANDQALYSQMKRLAGDRGVCYAGYRYFTRKLGIGYKAYKKSIEYLLENKWIENAGEKEVETAGGVQKVHVYIVNDIWKINIKYYQGGAKRKHPSKAGGLQRRLEGGLQSKHKKNIYIKKNSSSLKKPTFNGMEMRESKGKLWCLPSDGSDWLEFAGKKSDIVYK